MLHLFHTSTLTGSPGVINLWYHRVLAFSWALHFSAQVEARFEVNLFHIFQSKDQHPDEPIK